MISFFSSTSEAKLHFLLTAKISSNSVDSNYRLFAHRSSLKFKSWRRFESSYSEGRSLRFDDSSSKSRKQIRETYVSTRRTDIADSRELAQSKRGSVCGRAVLRFRRWCREAEGMSTDAQSMRPKRKRSSDEATPAAWPLWSAFRVIGKYADD